MNATESIRLEPVGEMKSLVFLRMPNGKERKVGVFDQYRGTYITERKFSKHYFKKLDAWGVADIVLHALMGLKKVIVRDVESHRSYEIAIEDMKKYGTYLNFRAKGFETQLFVPLNNWRETEYGTK